MAVKLRDDQTGDRDSGICEENMDGRKIKKNAGYDKTEFVPFIFLSTYSGKADITARPK
jgi:hypothetical protein